MVRAALLLTVLFLWGCGATADSAKKEQDYQRAHDAADRAFAELESGTSHGADLFIPTGNANYDRQQAAAEEAFKELDCTVLGICETPSAPSKTIEEKARPTALSEKHFERGVSKYPLSNGYPVWFLQPDYDGYWGGVGIAKTQNGGYPVQKRVATALAQADIARSINAVVYSETSTEEININSTVQKHYQHKFSTMSRQQADEYLANPVVMDEWLDDNSGELYVWVVLPR